MAEDENSSLFEIVEDGKRTHALSLISFMLLLLNVVMPIQHDIAFSLFLSENVIQAKMVILLGLIVLRLLDVSSG